MIPLLVKYCLCLMYVIILDSLVTLLLIIVFLFKSVLNMYCIIEGEK